MKISFIGVGMMGKGMAFNIAHYGGEFIAYDLDSARLVPFEQAGICTTQSLKEAADADIICMCVPNTKIVRSLVLGDDGIAPYLHAGQTIIDFSTIFYKDAEEIAKQLESQGIDFMDAPISGGKPRADDGTLTIMCGGKKEVFDRVEPLLKLAGTTILYMGGSGTGQIAKTINGSLFKLIIAGFCELMPLAVKMGLDPEKTERMLNTGVAASDASRIWLPKALDNDFNYVKITGGYKDLIAVRTMCEDNHIDLPTLNGAIQSFELGMKENPDLYFNGMILPYEKLLGVKCRRAKKEE